MGAEALHLLDIQTISQHAEWLFALGLPMFLQFSTQTIEKIRARDRKDGTPICRMCNRKINDGKGHVAHINHDHGKEGYDAASNGRLLCERCHYVDHVNRAGRNGVNPHRGKGGYTNSGQSNNFALRRIWEKLSEQERNGLLSPEEIIAERKKRGTYTIFLALRGVFNGGDV